MPRIAIGPIPAGSDSAPVLAEGIVIGTISRGQGLWRDASLLVDGKEVVRGIPDIIDHLRTAFDSVADVQIEIHPGYLALYGPDGAPYARVLSSGSRHQLRVFNPHRSETYETRDAAVDAGRYRPA